MPTWDGNHSNIPLKTHSATQQYPYTDQHLSRWVLASSNRNLNTKLSDFSDKSTRSEPV
jgi:hypothetical protein